MSRRNYNSEEYFITVQHSVVLKTVVSPYGGRHNRHDISNADTAATPPQDKRSFILPLVFLLPSLAVPLNAACKRAHAQINSMPIL